MELEHYQFETPNELTDVGIGHQWLLTPQKKRAPYSTGLLKENSTTHEVVLPKTWHWNPVKPLSHHQISRNTGDRGTCYICHIGEAINKI